MTKFVSQISALCNLKSPSTNPKRQRHCQASQSMNQVSWSGRQPKVLSVIVEYVEWRTSAFAAQFPVAVTTRAYPIGSGVLRHVDVGADEKLWLRRRRLHCLKVSVYEDPRPVATRKPAVVLVCVSGKDSPLVCVLGRFPFLTASSRDIPSECTECYGTTLLLIGSLTTITCRKLKKPFLSSSVGSECVVHPRHTMWRNLRQPSLN